jgi:hypothetical protein
MGEVTLTRAECKALEREARSQMDNSCDEYAFGQRHDKPDYVAQHQRSLLACAEILGALSWGRRSWPKDEPSLKLALTAETVAWLERQRRETELHVRELDESGEGDYKYTAREVFLLHVLNRIVGAARPEKRRGAALRVLDGGVA